MELAARNGRSDVEVIEHLDSLHISEGAISRARLVDIRELDRREVWQGSGCRDLVQWLSGRYGIAHYKARRWIVAAHAIESLPAIGASLESGILSLDKVCELCRFATPETERKLVSWAKKVSVACIRERGDAALRLDIEETKDAHDNRSVSWWYFDDGKSFGLEAFLPADQGKVIARALERLAAQLPGTPDKDESLTIDQRRADALVGLCSGALGRDGDKDRAAVVVHASLSALIDDSSGCSLEGGGVIHPEVCRELLCDGRLQIVLEGKDGDPLGIGHTSRVIPRWLRRQVMARDHGCTFPGCGTRRFIDIHHIVKWPKGPTSLKNLTALCDFHHKLVHRHGWRVELGLLGETQWFRPDGTRFATGPSPPKQKIAA